MFLLPENPGEILHTPHLFYDPPVQPRENNFDFLVLQTLSQIGNLSNGLVIDDLGVAQAEEEGRVPAVSAVVVDGEVDGPEVLIEVHEADGTWVRGRVPISLYITY